MMDEKGIKLDLENDFEIQKYEKANKVDVLKLVNCFISEKDSDFKDIITNIEKLVQKYNIDYYMLGEGKEVSKENIALVYNLKNRKSCVDCILKIFYQDNEKNTLTIKYMIEFSEGSSGIYFGFSFYNFFDVNNFTDISRLLEEYFSGDNSEIKDQKVINNCIINIQNRIKYYYSE